MHYRRSHQLSRFAVLTLFCILLRCCTSREKSRPNDLFRVLHLSKLKTIWPRDLFSHVRNKFNGKFQHYKRDSVSCVCIFDLSTLYFHAEKKPRFYQKTTFSTKQFWKNRSSMTSAKFSTLLAQKDNLFLADNLFFNFYIAQWSKHILLQDTFISTPRTSSNWSFFFYPLVASADSQEDCKYDGHFCVVPLKHRP